MKKRNKRKKLAPIKRLKTKAWKLLSEWVRRKDADLDGNAHCVTCGKRTFWNKLQGGHYLHGHSKPTYMAEINVNAQCSRCNRYLSGNLLEYHDYMLKTYGQEAVDGLKRLSHQVVKFDRSYYEELIGKYTIRLIELDRKAIS